MPITIRYVPTTSQYPDEDPGIVTLEEHEGAFNYEAIADALEEAFHAEGRQTRRTIVTSTGVTTPVPGGTQVVTTVTTIETGWRTSLPAPEE